MRDSLTLEKKHSLENYNTKVREYKTTETTSTHSPSLSI